MQIIIKTSLVQSLLAGSGIEWLNNSWSKDSSNIISINKRMVNIKTSNGSINGREINDKLYRKEYPLSKKSSAEPIVRIVLIKGRV